MLVLRIFIGGFLIYHGQEVFHADIVQTYLSWEVFKGPMGEPMIYLGKGLELAAGIGILFGFYTRFSALMCIGALAFVTFFIGNGRIWYEEQHPFLLVLFGVVFLFLGPGKWSLDAVPVKEEHKGYIEEKADIPYID